MIENAIIADANGATNISTHYAPTNLVMDGNVSDPSASSVWNRRAQPTLAAWQEATGKDTHSKTYSPEFVNPALGDLHLTPGDCCASAEGVAGSRVTQVDFDGDRGPTDRPAAGVDEPAPDRGS